MRSIGDLFKELGFNPEASTDAQKAFVQHLVKAAAAAEPRTQPQPTKPKVDEKPVLPQQMEFNFSDDQSPKKVS